MQQRIKNEKGYTLFLTLLITILFTVLAVVMVNFTMASMSKNKVREQYVQAQELSEKGLEHIVSEIQTQLQEKLGESGLTRTHFADELSALIDKYNCENGNEKIIIKGVGETGDYSSCIKPTRGDSGNDLRREVVFLSRGKVGGKEKEIKTTIEIGAQDVPEALKYVLGTTKANFGGKNGEGNVYLHGGAEIYGDMKVDNNLFTFGYGPGLHGSYSKWRKTTLPVLYPSKGTNAAKIVLGGDSYTFSSQTVDNRFTKRRNDSNSTLESSLKFYNSHLNWKDASIYQKANIKDLFANKNNLPTIVNRQANENSVSIRNKIQTAKENIKPTISKAEKVFTNINTNKSIAFKNYYYDYTWWGAQRYNNYMTISSNNRFKSGHILDGIRTTFRGGSHAFDQLYINTDVVIGNSTTIDNPRYYDEISIGGYSDDRGAQLFVNGDVTIQGANLKSNLTIYTTGKVTIQYSTIQGKQFSNKKEGSLIVFSKGGIHLSNNSLYKDRASELKGYFYSEDIFEMFGVGSKLKIHGGISAKRITLNAIRGNYLWEQGNFKYAINPTDLTSESRLIIEYDTDLIENFLKMNPPEPVIYNVDPPKTINRH